jgi:hypothetical protein
MGNAERGVPASVIATEKEVAEERKKMLKTVRAMHESFVRDAGATKLFKKKLASERANRHKNFSFLGDYHSSKVPTDIDALAEVNGVRFSMLSIFVDAHLGYFVRTTEHGHPDSKRAQHDIVFTTLILGRLPLPDRPSSMVSPFSCLNGM